MHLRLISKTLSIPHTSVSRKLKLLLKENVIDFKKEGKNKKFFLRDNLTAKNYIMNAERYKFNKILKKYPELSVILEEVIRNSSEMTILFGSYAKERAKKEKIK